MKEHIIYLSGPITGVEDYYEKFLKAEQKLQAEGWTVINPAKLGETAPSLDWATYMQIDMILLSKADAIYMLNGWQNSNGALLEKRFAETSNKIVLFEV